MNCVSGLADDGVEPVVIVSGVVDCPGGAVRFNKAVVALNFVSIPLLGLLLDVVGVTILNSILELVVSGSLNKIRV
jgi:hypothetical protein